MTGARHNGAKCLALLLAGWALGFIAGCGAQQIAHYLSM